jgi:hypothetical protein
MYFLGNASLLYQTSKEKFGGIKGVIRHRKSTMAKRKGQNDKKWPTTHYKQYLKIKLQEPHEKRGVNSCAHEG